MAHPVKTKRIGFDLKEKQGRYGIKKPQRA
jgi:hypothetical protein